MSRFHVNSLCKGESPGNWQYDLPGHWVIGKHSAIQYTTPQDEERTIHSVSWIMVMASMFLWYWANVVIILQHRGNPWIFSLFLCPVILLQCMDEFYLRPTLGPCSSKDRYCHLFRFFIHILGHAVPIASGPIAIPVGRHYPPQHVLSGGGERNTRRLPGSRCLLWRRGKTRCRGRG